MTKIRKDGTAKRPPPGRRAGNLNKTTKSAKEVIQWAASKLGGGPGLVRWAESDPQNMRLFWSSIWPKLLPLQIEGNAEKPLTINIVEFGEDLRNQLPEQPPVIDQAPPPPAKYDA